jgi:hypothetical protein
MREVWWVASRVVLQGVSLEGPAVAWQLHCCIPPMQARKYHITGQEVNGCKLVTRHTEGQLR